MVLFVICTLLLLYGLIAYFSGHKGRGALVFFFFLTNGFHFLSYDWCPIKYTDFALAYLFVVALYNAVNGNKVFFKPQSKVYRIVTIIGIYITLEFIRTILLGEEIPYYALANYRTYLPFFSFWLVQELKEREVVKLFKLIAIITIGSTVLFGLQPLLNVQFFQHATVGEEVYGDFAVRYRNIPYLAYFFLMLVTTRLDFRKPWSFVLLFVFLWALFLTMHRAVLYAYILCIGVYLFLARSWGKAVQFGFIGMVAILLVGGATISRFEGRFGRGASLEDVKIVLDLDYESAKRNEFENEGGTLSFRVLLLMERVDYLISHPKYLVFGIGTRHEDSPKTRQFDFTLGTHRASNDTIGQISSGDLAWVNPLMNFGFLGIALLLYLSWLIIRYLYYERKISSIAMASFLYYLLLLILSFKNDHLYGNMQMFFLYLLIENIRYTHRSISDSTRV